MRSKINRLHIYGYASGNFAKNLQWSTFDVTLLFVMTDVFQLSPATASIIVGSVFGFGALLDMLVGFLADRVEKPFGRYGTLILIGAPLCAAGFAGFYILPHLDVTSLTIITLCLLLFRIGYALMDIPHNAILTRLSDAGEIRSRIAILRFFFSTLAYLMLSLGLIPLTQESAATRLSTGSLAVYGVSIAIIAGLIIVGSWLSIRTSSRYPQEKILSPKPPAIRQIVGIIQYHPLALAILVGAVAVFTLTFFNRSVLFLATHVLGETRTASYLLTAMVTGQLLSIPIWLRLVAKITRSRALQIAHFLCAIGFCTMFFVADSIVAEIFLLMSCLIIGVGTCGVYSLIWGLVADCSSALQQKTGVDNNGAIFGIAVTVQKLSLAASAGFLGWGLEMTGYSAINIQEQQATDAIRVINSIIPMLGAILCAYILSLYEKHKTFSN